MSAEEAICGMIFFGRGDDNERQTPNIPKGVRQKIRLSQPYLLRFEILQLLLYSPS